jgi:hypothetical protein
MRLRKAQDFQILPFDKQKVLEHLISQNRKLDSVIYSSEQGKVEENSTWMTQLIDERIRLAFTRFPFMQNNIAGGMKQFDIEYLLKQIDKRIAEIDDEQSRNDTSSMTSIESNMNANEEKIAQSDLNANEEKTEYEIKSDLLDSILSDLREKFGDNFGLNEEAQQ